MLDTELLHVLRPDGAGPVRCPGPGHGPHLAPGEVRGVQLEDGGVVISVASKHP